ncbi:homeobox protein NANOG [Epinephelus lanceolatus]|uniref:homeobox protein NANOG n=1 Tax=Epinephelus lanceolatus TaxID=310571 RepID=UPI0014459BB1|nr:homeobox protein NANOG [Epinephelus lanceolatus]
MADWKTQISYNYNASYHAYAYGLVYPPGAEQNHGSLTNWGEDQAQDLSNYNAGMAQAYYTTTDKTHEESPPGSPDGHAVNIHGQFQGPGVLHLGDSPAGRLLLAGAPRVAYNVGAHEVRRVRSDSTSDSEAHTSPDSWSSGSSKEGGLPRADPATWANKDLDDETCSRSPDASEDVPNTLVEEPKIFTVSGDEGTNNTTSLSAPLTAPKKPSTTSAAPKGKVRSAFSESQMNALVQRFSVKRYLTPNEMRNLADLTGLTYKQVKTWFQNRRMKLRRHQKDTSWVSERYGNNKGSPIGPMYTNITSHIPPYQGEALTQLKGHYNQHMMGTAFKKTPQNLAFYLAAMGSAGGPAGYSPWSPGSSQTGAPSRPQAAGWSMPSGVSHYDYDPNAFSPVGAASVNNIGQGTSFDNKDGDPVNGRTSLNAAIVHNVNQ